MTTVIGVRFKKAGKVYYFDPTDVWPKPGDNVVVETARGIELGEAITSAREVEDDQIVSPLKKVIRVATEEDVRRAEYNTSREKDAFRICQERIEQHKLEMKLVDVEYTFDGSKVVFYFTANGRVDFRELVKDLASVFKMRIELRQIGVRDEAKMLGGLGSCGRPICCGSFLGDFQPVSIKMAKEQNLSLNPAKISGQCGRLMCCLKYEQDYYEAVHKRLPRVGREAMTPDGPGVIVEINPIREKVRVRIRTSDDSYDMREYSLEEVTRPASNPEAGERPQEARPARPPRKPKETPAPEQNEEEKPARRRIPRPKGPKQLNTDQYFDRLDAERKDVRAEKEPRERKPRPPKEIREPREGWDAKEQPAPIAPATPAQPE